MKNKHLIEIVASTKGRIAIPTVTMVGMQMSYAPKDHVLSILAMDLEDDLWIAVINGDDLFLTCGDV